MPRVPDVHLHSVVYIYPSAEDARLGTQVGGSGFVVTHPSGIGDFRMRYVVTNKHVVDNGGHYVRVNSTVGTHTVHIPPDSWEWAVGNDDIAVAVLPLPTGVRIYELSLDTLALTQTDIDELRVGPGDEIYMVGRLIAHSGRLANHPITRFGNVALMPSREELVRDGRGLDVEAYLIEMRSHAGFSGSPVFLVIPQNSFRGAFGDTTLDDNKTRFRLLGVDTGHKDDLLRVYQREDDGHRRIRDDLQVHHFSDIAIVAPIWLVLDILERPEVARVRLEWGEQMQRMST